MANITSTPAPFPHLPARRPSVAEPVVLLFLLVLPYGGLWLLSFLLATVPAGSYDSSLNLLSVAILGTVAGLLATRLSRLVAFALGWVPLLLLTLPFVLVGEAALAPVLWELAVVTVAFVAGHQLRGWASSNRLRRAMTAGLFAVTAVVVIAPAVIATYQAGGRVGWETMAYPGQPVTLSLPGEFGGAYMWNRYTDAYTFYGNDRATDLRVVTLDSRTSLEDWAASLEQDDAFQWGPPEASEFVQAGGRTWMVRTYAGTSVPQVHEETGARTGTRPVFVVEGITVAANIGVQVAIAVDRERDLDGARVTLLEMLDTVTVNE